MVPRSISSYNRRVPVADLDTELDLSLVLHALSDPQRRTIVRELAASEEPLPCGTIELEVGKSTRTHHFRVLREAGLIEQQRDGTRKLTSLRREAIEVAFPGLLDAVLNPAATP
ncbi:MAG: helix-turn-helix transcriptional regulator [Actinobacteria bacterium]|nr:helix-turn-helix transcriptional regulator [Actinomycetota bacterium]